MSNTFFAIIPAGGSGTRLWPLSRSRKPKFLLPLPGPRTMIQETVTRLAPLAGNERTFIVTGTAHVEEVSRQLPRLHREQIIVEPTPRGSGPAIGLATAIIHHREPDAIVGSFAADHVVMDTSLFEGAVRAAIDTATRGYLATIGLEPKYPETGYGYIRRGESISTFEDINVARVDAFKEKPDAVTAIEYVLSGNYLWNASMFVWSAATLMNEMWRYLPEIADAVTRIASAWDTDNREMVFHDIWPQISDVSIDHGILEKSDRVAVVPGTFGWADLGDWHSFGLVTGDGNGGTVVHGADLLTRDVRDCIVMGNARTVALVGLEDIVVVDTDDALLVCHRSRAQDVKNIVEELKQRQAVNLL